VLKCITDTNTLIRASLLSLPSSLFLFPPPVTPLLSLSPISYLSPPYAHTHYTLPFLAIATYTTHIHYNTLQTIAIVT